MATRSTLEHKRRDCALASSFVSFVPFVAIRRGQSGPPASVVAAEARCGADSTLIGLLRKTRAADHIPHAVEDGTLGAHPPLKRRKKSCDSGYDASNHSSSQRYD
jgi:hypothetical protein